MNVPSLSALALLAAPLAHSHDTGGSSPKPPQVSRASLGSGMQDFVHYDEREDALWAVGHAWKMRFDPEGATYIPYLGSSAPRNYPMEFRLESARVGGVELELDRGAAPTRDGNSVQFDRGSLVESYELETGSVEQLFQLADAPRTGDLVLNILVETDLARSERVDALVFQNDRGEVRYSKAVAIDGTGARLNLSTRFTEGTIEIRVPHAFLESAQGPLTIDPVIMTFSLDDSAQDDRLPDVAWGEAEDRFMAVWDREFSNTDHDVYSLFLEEDGTVVPFSGAFIDATDENWEEPSVGYVHWQYQQFLVAAERGPNGSRDIAGRLRAATGAVDFPFQVTNISGEELNPTVGGDLTNPGVAVLLPPSFLVVYERILSAADHDILAQRVRGDGNLQGGTTFIDGSPLTLDIRPAVTSSRNGDSWTVVWEREVSSSNHDIRGATVDIAGGASVAFTVDASAGNQTQPTVSRERAGSDEYVVVYQHRVSSVETLRARLLSGSSVVDTLSVSDEDGSDPGKNHFDPDVTTDGCRFTVTYSQQLNGFTSDIYATGLVALPGGLTVDDEGAVLLGGSGEVEQNPTIASKGRASTDLLITWERKPLFGPEFDVDGAVFHSSAPFNDCCFHILILLGTGFVNPWSTVGATTDGDPIPGCSPLGLVPNDIWFRFTPLESGMYSISTCGGTTADTVIAVYDGGNCPVGAPIACDNNSCGSQSFLLFNAIAGNPYRIRIGTIFGEREGTFRVQKVEADGVTYCTSAPNSVSATGAKISMSGSTSQMANDLALLSSPLPPGAPGIFYFGGSATDGPFGDGFRCVGGQTFRLPVTFASANGEAAFGVDDTVFPMTLLTAGFTWYFQHWYRDPGAMGSGFNLSDGLELTFLP